MKFLFFIFLLSIKIHLIYTEIWNWWIYEREDSDIILDSNSEETETFLEDQVKCQYEYEKCYTINSELESKPPFDNKCCRYKTEEIDTCLTIFSGKYKKTNLYSLDKSNKDFSYDCDGSGLKTYDSSLFTSNQNWEIIVREKLDCIYSKDENECKSLPKSFEQNTKCCWFTNDQYTSYASCFGMSEITDEEFNRTIPYLALATYSADSGEMEFRCYDKSDKVVKGKYNLKLYVSEMGSAEEKLLQELMSENALDIFSKKQNFIKIKEYDKELTNSFQIWTVSPNKNVRKFVVSVKFSYTITSSKTKSSNRNLEAGTAEKIASCDPVDIDENSNLNLTTSKCTFSNDEGYIAEKIEIQPGHDLIGNFNDENKVATPGTNSSYDEIKKLDEDTVYFIFKDAITQLNSNVIEGEIGEDRKNVEFVLYHQKNNQTFETVKAKADFLKENKSIHFVTEPEIDFNEGVTLIPNQLAKSGDGKYLYIQNKIAKRGNSTNYNSYPDDDSISNIIHPAKKSSGLSTGAILAIIIPCCVVLVGVAIVATIMAKQSNPATDIYNTSSSSNAINN